jgi:copper/silver efflux system protein
MIAKLIDLCIRNRTMVLLLTAFVAVAGAWAMYHITIDAIPDLSDVQVIVRTEYQGQAPQIVEDQITYPLTTTMLSVPKSKVVRGYSMFGMSFVYVIFEDGTDQYWARSRVLEQLSFVAGKLPAGVTPQLGPDATGVGWVYEYALVTGPYCPDHPNGAWHDPTTDRWYADPSQAPADDAVQMRLIHHRVFDATMERCPLDGKPLRKSDQSLADLRSLQDWRLRYELTALDGVSEVAAIGGFVKQYQVTVDPVKLLAYNVPLSQVKMAIQQSNLDVGGRVIEMSETEYMVRGVGYLGSVTDREVAGARAEGRSLASIRTAKVLKELGLVSLGATEGGSPLHLSDVATIRLGPDIRRGVADWDGQGETVGGIIVMRFGENARTTIEHVRHKLASLEATLPPGVAVETAYDRSDLIDRAVGTLRQTLIEEIAVVSLVCILFLLHARSALVAAFVLPTGVLATLAVMHFMGINANIMSLGGIAIAIGVMVDSSIIMVENAHKHLEYERARVAAGGRSRPHAEVIAEAAREVGPSLFFALLIIVVSFLPIFVLGDQSGRLFKPLAYTKTFAMAAGAILAVTVIPVLMVFFIRERLLPRSWNWAVRLAVYIAVIAGPAVLLAFIPLPVLHEYRWAMVVGWVVLSALVVLPQRIPSEHRNPISRVLEALYNPLFALFMRFRWPAMIGAIVLVAMTWLPLSRLGSEFMPPLEEGDLLYMPTTDPGISMAKARELLQQTDALIKRFPEVVSVLGKAGGADSATDPAPQSMLETTITLDRDKDKWRQVPVERFFGNWPGFLRRPLARLWPLARPITTNELVYGYELPGAGIGGTPLHVPGMNEALQVPGLTNSWTMPIKTRIDMLSTGIKTPVGIKIMGPDLATLSDLADQVAQVIKTSEGTGPYTVSAFPEKTVGGLFFDVRIRRDEIARYGLTVSDVQDVIATALGGANITYTVEGLERYPVNLRYPSELRDRQDVLRETLVATPSGAQVPLGQLADFEIHKGPPMIKSEGARLTSWVYVDIADLDVGTYVARARGAVAEKVRLPEGYTILWSGQYEYMQAARERLLVAIPLALVLIVLLLYVSTRSWLRVAIVMLAVPFSLVGAVWLLYFMDYHLSLAVAVGLIALAGLDAETGVVMLLYLDTSVNRFRREGRLRDKRDLWWAIHDGAVKRIRPKMMTVMAAGVGLLPLVWAEGAGADTMRRLAVPMIGGLATSFVMELLIYPVVYYSVRRIGLLRHDKDHASPEPAVK